MRTWTISLLTILFLLSASSAFAEANPRLESLIDSYIEAFSSQDPEATLEAWKDINTDPLAMKYLQENHRAVHAHFKLKELAYRLQKLQGQTPGALIPRREFPSRIRGQQSLPSQQRGQLRGNRSNRSISTGSPNQNRPSNQASFVPNSSRRPNSISSVRDSSNRSRAFNQSNQRRLRRR